MKDPLLNYIEENKQELDTHIPDAKNWEAIQTRLNQSKKRTNTIAFMASIAAVFIAGISIVNYNSSDSADQLSYSVTDDQLNTVSDSTSVIRFEEMDYEFSHNLSSDYSYVGFRNVQTHIGRDGETWGDGEVLVAALDGSISYSVVATDDNGCYSEAEDLDLGYFNKYHNHNFIRGRIDPNSNQVADSQYDVDRYYEQYDDFDENEFETPLVQPLSTFGIDVDGAGYSNMRRYIQSGYLPPKNAVKLEEMMNYFKYDLPEPDGADPFSIRTELGQCPWQEEHLLMQVALQGEHIEMDENQSNNLVFLIDVSGSMDENDKLPLLKKSLYLLVNEMGSDDRIAIVVYAGAAGLVLPSTSGREKAKIYDAIESLNSGGSTAGGEGIDLAYRVANDARIKTGNNHIILATDGDFNVGVSDDDALVELIEQKRKTGISLSVLGFGTGNLQNSKMEKLADNGNGNYNYIDNIMEAKKVLVDEIGGTLITIAKDVKLQLEFNPEHVKSYRLLGYENRVMAAKDFDNDAKDSGDLGSGHSVVALYEIVPTDELKIQSANDLRYQKKIVNNSKGLKEELAVIKFRYKKPNGSKSKLIERIVMNAPSENLSDNFEFASAVVEFGMLIRESNFRGSASFDAVIARAKASKGEDEFGYRAEFIQLVERAKMLMTEYFATIKN